MPLVRKELVFTVLDNQIIDYNYNHRMQTVLYNMMSKIDKNKAMKLHDEGFKIDNKRFKLFNFSLFFMKYETTEEGIKVKKGSKVKLILSGKSEIIKTIIHGFIKAQQFKFYDTTLKLEDMLDDKKFNFSKVMLYKVRTPIVESIFDAETKKIIYLNTLNQEYYKALAFNLMRKYELVYGEKYNGELYFDIENVLNVRKKYIRVKNGYLVGYYNFELFVEAEPKMQMVSYFLGFGQNNSLGMGMVSYITGRRC